MEAKSQGLSGGRKPWSVMVTPETYAEWVQPQFNALYGVPASGRNTDASNALRPAIETYLAPLFVNGPLSWERFEPYLSAQAALAQRDYEAFEPAMREHYSAELEWIDREIGPIAAELVGRPFPGEDLTTLLLSAREQVAESYADITSEMSARQGPVTLREAASLAREVSGLAAGYQMTVDEPLPWTADSTPTRGVCYIYALPCMSGRAQITNTRIHEWRHSVQSQIASEGPGGYANITLLHTKHKPLVEGDATGVSGEVMVEAARRGLLDSTEVSRELRDEARYHGRWRTANPGLAQLRDTPNNYATGLTQIRAITLGLTPPERRAVMFDPRGMGRSEGEQLAEWGSRLRTILIERDQAVSPTTETQSPGHTRRLWSPASRVLRPAANRHGSRRL